MKYRLRLLYYRVAPIYNSYNMQKKKKLNMNIASIRITLTEINNEKHYVTEKKINKKATKKQRSLGRI
jgi:hypothetical protein